MAFGKKQSFQDDGRTIANMDVPGMPWHGNKSQQATEEIQRSAVEELGLTKEEKRAVLKGVLMAVLPIGAIFGVAYVGILLFIQYVWLA